MTLGLLAAMFIATSVTSTGIAALLPSAPASAITPDAYEELCRTDPGNSQCTGTKETCEAHGLNWIDPPGTCGVYSKAQCLALSEGKFNDETGSCSYKTVPSGSSEGMTLENRTKSYVYLNAIRLCMRDKTVNDNNDWDSGVYVSPASIESGDWFNKDDGDFANSTGKQNISASYLAPNVVADSGEVLCNDAIKEGWKLWGYSSAKDMFCDFSPLRQGDNSPSCASGSGDFDDFSNSDHADAFYAAIKKKVYNNATPSLEETIGSTKGFPGRYLLYLSAFSKGCSAKESTSASTDFAYDNIKIVGDDGIFVEKDYEGLKHDVKRKVYVDRDNLNVVEKSCKDIAAAVNEYAGIYASYRKLHPTEPTPKSAQSCAVGDTSCSAVAGSSCVIDGVGWIVCAAANFMASVADGIYGIITNLLKVPVINTDIDNAGNGVYNAWKIMRTFANIAFVIVFLIIIFAQLTGLGVSNYGVKKTLPRLIVAAVLVNISFWITALAVDLSNIIGSGIYEVLSGVKDTMNIGISSNWTSIITALLAGGTIIVTAGTGVVAAGVAALAVAATGPTGVLSLVLLALPVVLGAVLAVLILVFVLIARQALVIILIIISPLAFVAMLLPNTEKLFTKWRQLLMSLLLMFPVVSLLFGGSQIAGLAILSSAASLDALAGGIAIITGQFVMVAPFFFLPVILTKFSGGNLDKLAGTLTSKGQKLIGGVSGSSRKLGGKLATRSFGLMKHGSRPTSRTRIGRLGQSLGSGGVGAIGRMAEDIVDGGAQTDAFIKEERQKQHVNRLATDTAYATRVAGGNAQVGERLAERARAAELETRGKDIKAAGLKLAGMDRTATRAVAYGYNEGADHLTRLAGIQNMVSTNDVEGMSQVADSLVGVQGPEADEMRQVLGNAMESSSGRPTFFGAGYIARLKAGAHADTRTEIISAVNDGAYSPAKIAGADKDELTKVAEVLDPKSTDETILKVHKKLQDATNAALGDKELKRTMGKNLDIADSIGKGESVTKPLT